MRQNQKQTLSHREVAQLVSGVQTQAHSDSISHIPRSRPTSLPFLQCPGKRFKGRTGKTQRQMWASACNVGTRRDRSQWRGGTGEGRDKCGNNLLREAGTSCRKGTAGRVRIRGKKRSGGKDDTVRRWRKGLEKEMQALLVTGGWSKSAIRSALLSKSSGNLSRLKSSTSRGLSHRSSSRGSACLREHLQMQILLNEWNNAGFWVHLILLPSPDSVWWHHSNAGPVSSTFLCPSKRCWYYACTNSVCCLKLNSVNNERLH